MSNKAMDSNLRRRRAQQSGNELLAIKDQLLQRSRDLNAKLNEVLWLFTEDPVADENLEDQFKKGIQESFQTSSANSQEIAEFASNYTEIKQLSPKSIRAKLEQYKHEALLSQIYNQSGRQRHEDDSAEKDASNKQTIIRSKANKNAVSSQFHSQDAIQPVKKKPLKISQRKQIDENAVFRNKCFQRISRRIHQSYVIVPQSESYQDRDSSEAIRSRYRQEKSAQKELARRINTQI